MPPKGEISTAARRCGRVRTESSASLPDYYTTHPSPCQAFFQNFHCFFCDIFLFRRKNQHFHQKSRFVSSFFLHLANLTKKSGENCLFWIFTKSDRCGIITRQLGNLLVVCTVYRPFFAECQSYDTNTRKAAYYAVLFFCLPPQYIM